MQPPATIIPRPKRLLLSGLLAHLRRGVPVQVQGDEALTRRAQGPPFGVHEDIAAERATAEGEGMPATPVIDRKQCADSNGAHKP
jgi:hypothetical protein